MKVAVVGLGRVGTAFATLLERAGHARVEEIADADVVLITTPDDAIAETSARIAGELLEGQVVAHVSGAVRLEALAAARSAGARVLSLHPLQTFPDPESAIERLPGSTMAVTAEDEAAAEVGEQLARDLGTTSVRVPDDVKPLYHAAAVLASNDVVAILAEAERVFRAAGIEDRTRWMPLVRASMDNVERLGPEAALTGPAARGDAGTIEANLLALERDAPDAIPVYVALAAAALDVAERAGRLDAAARVRVEEVLSRWR